MSFNKYIVSPALICSLSLSAVLAQASFSSPSQNPAPASKAAPTSASAPVAAPHPSAKQDALSIYREAGVNAEQEAKIRQMAQGFDKENSVRMQRLMNLLHEMRGLSLAPDPDEKAVLAKQDEVNKLQSESAVDRVKLLLKIRSTLTPEQKKNLVQLMQKSMGPSGPQP